MTKQLLLYFILICRDSHTHTHNIKLIHDLKTNPVYTIKLHSIRIQIRSNHKIILSDYVIEVSVRVICTIEKEQVHYFSSKVIWPVILIDSTCAPRDYHQFIRCSPVHLIQSNEKRAATKSVVRVSVCVCVYGKRVSGCFLVVENRVPFNFLYDFFFLFHLFSSLIHSADVWLLLHTHPHTHTHAFVMACAFFPPFSFGCIIIIVVGI